MNCSRRFFLQSSVKGLPLAFSLSATRTLGAAMGAGDVRLGVQTYSFRDMLSTPGDTTDKMIAAMRQLRLLECEVFEPTLQPPALSAAAPWRMAGGKPTEASLSGRPPEGPPTSAENANEIAIREWRLGPGLDDVKAAAEKFRRAGIRVLAFNYGLHDSCTDEEIERGLEMTRALGAEILSASTTLSMAKRAVPFFEKHGIQLAVHGHSNASDPNHFATPASFAEALGMSDRYRVNLDIGHFVPPVSIRWLTFVRITHASRISTSRIEKLTTGPTCPGARETLPLQRRCGC